MFLTLVLHLSVLASGVPRHYGLAALRPFRAFPVLAVGRYVCVHIHDHASLGVLKTLIQVSVNDSICP